MTAGLPRLLVCGHRHPGGELQGEPERHCLDDTWLRGFYVDAGRHPWEGQGDQAWVWWTFHQYNRNTSFSAHRLYCVFIEAYLISVRVRLLRESTNRTRRFGGGVVGVRVRVPG